MEVHGTLRSEGGVRSSSSLGRTLFTDAHASSKAPSKVKVLIGEQAPAVRLASHRLEEAMGHFVLSTLTDPFITSIAFGCTIATLSIAALAWHRRDAHATKPG